MRQFTTLATFGYWMGMCCCVLPAEIGQTRFEIADVVSQYGITWTFSKPATVGRFANGDYYVVGDVTVKSIDPPPLIGAEVPSEELSDAERLRIKSGRFVRNGSIVNPAARQIVAYDTGVRNYSRPEFAIRVPIQLKPGDCLVSTISLKKGERDHFPYHGGDGPREHHDNSPIKTAAILTCTSVKLPVDALRPSYGDRQQKIYRTSDLRAKLLPQLKPPSGLPDINMWIRVFERPWVNPCFFGFEQPMENMPHYGQWIGEAQSMAGLLLMLDLPSEQKRRLLINVVQVGVDYWGLVRNGHPGWEGWGGHGSGRKFPIVFAGLMLGDEEMASPTKHFPKVEFGEDNQTVYGKGWTGARALFAGHSGIQSSSGKPERPQWGPYEHLHPNEWSKFQMQSEAYRRGNTSSCWVGQALVLRMLHAEKYWNHDAFFDYVERWMNEDDVPNRREILKHWPEERLGERDTWMHQANTREPFVKSMWDLYRKRVDEIGAH